MFQLTATEWTADDFTGADGDHAYHWTGTTHVKMGGDGSENSGRAAYISFFEALGYMNSEVLDVHGAGAQRSDPKSEDPGFSRGDFFGPQGDFISIENYVLLVRSAEDPDLPFDENVIANTSQAKGISAIYETLLGGVPNQTGFNFLINGNNATNFGSGTTTVFNDENIYINIAHALVQGNATATTAFNALGSGATLVDQITSLYQAIIPVASQTTDGLAYLTSTANLTFYTSVAAERGITSDNGPAIIAFASLLKSR